ncbi:MAG: hypothetical protein J5985_06310 [Kiritimatiellae bacterium]|nr:hypothetical protein [Kiritimatiellia bacterium]
MAKTTNLEREMMRRMLNGGNTGTTYRRRSPTRPMPKWFTVLTRLMRAFQSLASLFRAVKK